MSPCALMDLLGRKSGRGFCDAREQGAADDDRLDPPTAPPKPDAPLLVHGRGVWPEMWMRTLADAGDVPRQVADSPALVGARMLANVINEAADAVLQGVCSEAAAHAAMTLGVTDPVGPCAWLYMRDSGAGITHSLPMTLGLDGAGTVAELDADERTLRLGQRVVVHPGIGCGRCEFCRRA